MKVHDSHLEAAFYLIFYIYYSFLFLMQKMIDDDGLSLPQLINTIRRAVPWLHHQLKPLHCFDSKSCKFNQ
eukprot:COSAG06_NODE_2456_length_6848_cov_66.970959_10_plen_71_part_00